MTIQVKSKLKFGTRCPHYFINNCNSLDKSFGVGSESSKLMSLDNDYLSTRFINNYTERCVYLCF